MKKQMNQFRQINSRNLLNFFLVALIIFMTFGCSGAIQDFKKGFNESYDKRKGSTNTTNTPDGSDKTGGELADEIIGTWETQDKDKTRFTFGKDGSLVFEQEESAPQNATYSVLDKDAVEVKAEGKPKLVIIIKISGDTMRMDTQNRGSQTLKRIK